VSLLVALLSALFLFISFSRKKKMQPKVLIEPTPKELYRLAVESLEKMREEPRLKSSLDDFLSNLKAAMRSGMRRRYGLDLLSKSTEEAIDALSGKLTNDPALKSFKALSEKLDTAKFSGKQISLADCSGLVEGVKPLIE